MDKWIEINIDAIENNLRQVQSLLGEKTRLIAVIKANAYGHGAVETARILCRNGVKYLGVSFYYEGLQLRQEGIDADILVFTPVISEADAAAAINHKLTLTLGAYTDLELLDRVCQQLDLPVKVHLKLETGLGRFGLNKDEAVLVCHKITLAESILLEGIYTHIADPPSRTYTDQQFRQFMQAVGRLEQEGFKIPIRHIANSAMVLSSPEKHLDAVRVGTLLSGQQPYGSFSTNLQLQDPYRFKSRIVSLKTMKRGSFLGYYRTFKLKKTARIGVIPVGLNDGLGVETANPPMGLIDMLKKIAKMILGYFNFGRFNLNVYIKGEKYPIRGKIFMQMALVEIPLEADVNLGDEVEVPVRKTLASPAITRLYVRSRRTEAGN
ncbi:MAG: alanine racemase [Syntrophomonadaceae bacterium]|nr:alanine racemase [Syntrophomonadaceae bacterium]